MPDEAQTKPAFDKTLQIGIVVPDLEKAIRTYRDVYGIGGWQIMNFEPGDARDVRVHGQPTEWRWRKAATTMVGDVMWELIEPLDQKDDLFGRVLAERSDIGGVHHIAVGTPDISRVIRQQAALGNEPIMSGTFCGMDIAFLDTRRDLGVILEVFSQTPDAVDRSSHMP